MLSMSRFDEEFIRESVESCLREADPTIQIEHNKPDPPDCYVLGNGRKIPLEITRAEVEFMNGEERQTKLS
jgi:hypothetical protein